MCFQPSASRSFLLHFRNNAQQASPVSNPPLCTLRNSEVTQDLLSFNKYTKFTGGHVGAELGDRLRSERRV